MAWVDQRIVSETPGQPTGPGAPDDAQRTALPTWNRSRTKRTEPVGTAQEAEIVDALPSDDAFQRGVKNAGAAAARRVPLMLAGLVVIGGIGAGVVAWQQYQEGKRATATHAIAQAAALVNRGMEEGPMLGERKNVPVPIYKDESDRDAQIASQIEALKGVGSGSTALFEHLLAAGQAMRARDWPKAVAAYDLFISQAPADHPLRALALDGRCAAKENQGDLPGALADAQVLASEGSKEPGRTLGQWHEARILALQGDASAAAKLKALVERKDKTAVPFAETAKYLLTKVEAGEKITYAPLVIPATPKVAEPAPAPEPAAAAPSDPSSATAATSATTESAATSAAGSSAG